MSFKETKEGQTYYCTACEEKAHYGKSDEKHTCGLEVLRNLRMKDQKDIWRELEDLKCINGAMYFGSVEKECDCGKTNCSNSQTFEHAFEELKNWIKQNFIEKREVREKIEKLKQLTYPINVEKQDEKWNYLNGYNQALQDVLDNLE